MRRCPVLQVPSALHAPPATPTRTLAPGANVRARFRGEGAAPSTSWYPGVVEKANTDGTFTIAFDDGDVEDVEATYIKFKEPPPSPPLITSPPRAFATLPAPPTPPAPPATPVALAPPPPLRRSARTSVSTTADEADEVPGVVPEALRPLREQEHYHYYCYHYY